MSCTSKGIISHWSGCSRTMISCAAQPAAGVFHHRECLRQDFVQPAGELFVVLDFGKLLFPGSGFCAQFVVGELLQLGLGVIDFLDERPELFHFAVVPSTRKSF